jgi:16S rRNA processing protein RimM
LQPRDLIQIGKIIKLSGHTGELIIYSPTLMNDFKDFTIPIFIDISGEKVPFYVEEMTYINKERTVVKFQYVNTEKKAQSLIDKNIFIVSSNPNEDKMKFDWKGYLVIDENYGEVGKMSFVDENAKNPLMIILNGSTEILIPYREEFIVGMDEKEKILVVNCPEGLLDIYLKMDEEE